ncbi:MAG: hypothetical protein LBG65_01030 [Puniceicoccales bacterium]|nr:hypothetical protein [Puniceicoccales bacterium]
MNRLAETIARNRAGIVTSLVFAQISNDFLPRRPLSVLWLSRTHTGTFSGRLMAVFRAKSRVASCGCFSWVGAADGGGIAAL